MSFKIELPRKVDEGWASGQTFGEANCFLWEDDATGLTCCAIRDERGLFYTGYVGIENNHPCFGLAVDELPRIVVHGGVTFSGAREYLHWIGFHCCHKLDIAPGFDRGRSCDTYRDLKYVVLQCESLAKQLADIEREVNAE